MLVQSKNSSIFNFNMRLFLYKVVFFLLLFFLPVYLLFYLGHNGFINEQQHLLSYQKERIAQSNAKILFLGDSSLGYSLDEEVFGDLSKKTTLNAALTGLYGYAGSFNLLKQASEENDSLEMVIIASVPELLARPISREGFFRTLNIEDVFRVDIVWIFKLCASYMKTVKLNKREIIQNYIEQNPRDLDERKFTKIRPENIVVDKVHYLRRIKNYCDSAQIKFLYMNAPSYDSVLYYSQDFLERHDSILTLNNIDFVAERIVIPVGHLGDTYNHIDPLLKSNYTNKYFDILEDYLITP